MGFGVALLFWVLLITGVVTIVVRVTRGRWPHRNGLLLTLGVALISAGAGIFVWITDQQSYYMATRGYIADPSGVSSIKLICVVVAIVGLSLTGVAIRGQLSKPRSSSTLRVPAPPQVVSSPGEMAPAVGAAAHRPEAPDPAASERSAAPVPSQAVRACGTCGAQLKPSARFCVACGGSVPVSCRGCGESLQEGARFCGSCGLAVLEPVPIE